jgi:hypothetical protein
MAARTAKQCFFGEFIEGPDPRFVISDGGVTIKTRIPLTAAFEFDGNDIEITMPVMATSLGIDPNTKDLLSVDYKVHATIPSSSNE